MEGLCDIRAAVVDDDPLPLFGIESELLFGIHLIEISREKGLSQIQIEKARSDRLHPAKDRDLSTSLLPQPFGKLLRDLHRIFVIALRPGHRPVALILTKIRAVGDRHSAKLRIIAAEGKSGLHRFLCFIKNSFHIFLPL